MFKNKQGMPGVRGYYYRVEIRIQNGAGILYWLDKGRVRKS
jgi:hypothetical protein